MKKASSLLFVCAVLCASCSDKNGALAKVFDEKEMETVDKIISFYDDFIMNQTINKDIPLEKAYMAYMQVNTLLRQHAGGDMSIFRPDVVAELSFFKTLDQKALAEIFIVGDIDEQEKAMIMDYKMPSFRVNTKGKYMAFLNEMAKRSDFYGSYAEYVAATGDLGPKCYGAVMAQFEKFDFRKKDERFVFIVNMLRLE